MSGLDTSQQNPITPKFTSASVARVTPQTVSQERAAQITEKAERLTAKAEAHFEKHRGAWTNRQYGKLLARDGERMELRPQGMMSDRKSHLMRAADHLVRQKQAARLTSINRAASNMLCGRRCIDVGR
jgi:hypothetical protein